jgi:hypothetical protein
MSKPPFTHKDLDGIWARLLPNGVLEMRDINSGQSPDPEDKPRFQYRVRDGLLLTRTLPAESTGSARWRGWIDEPWWEPMTTWPLSLLLRGYCEYHGLSPITYSLDAPRRAGHVAAFTPNGREVRREAGKLIVQPENDNYWLTVADLRTAQEVYYGRQEGGDK